MATNDGWEDVASIDNDDGWEDVPLSKKASKLLETELDPEALKGFALNFAGAPLMGLKETGKKLLATRPDKLSLEDLSNTFVKTMEDYQYEPKTEKGKKALKSAGNVLDAAVQSGGWAMKNTVGAIPFIGEDLSKDFESELRMGGEVGIQFAPVPGLTGKRNRGGIHPDEMALLKEKLSKGWEDVADVPPQKAPDPVQLEFPDEIMRGRQEQQSMYESLFGPENSEMAAREAAQGELRTMEEQAAFGSDPLTKDMFNEPNFGTTKVESLPFERTTPEQLALERDSRLALEEPPRQEGIPYTPEIPENPALRIGEGPVLSAGEAMPSLKNKPEPFGPRPESDIAVQQADLWSPERAAMDTPNLPTPNLPEMPTKPLGGTGKRGFGQGGAIDPSIVALPTRLAWRRIFNTKALSSALEQSPKSRDTVVSMPAQNFLKLAMQIPSERVSDWSSKKLQNLDKVTDRKIPLADIPTLVISKNPKGEWQVVAHEGRHRAILSGRDGLKELPVILRTEPSPYGDALRWGEVDPKDIPRQIRGEESSLRPNISSSNNVVDIGPNLTFPEGRNSVAKMEQEYARAMETRDTAGIAMLGNRLGRGAFRQGGAFTPFAKRAAKDKNITNLLMEGKREFELDRRPLAEVIKELPKKLNDFTEKSTNLAEQSLRRLSSLAEKNLLQDRTIALLEKTSEGTGKLIKWTVDQVSIVERDMLTKTKTALDNTLVPFRHAFRNKTERKLLKGDLDNWFKNIGVRALTKEDFKSSRGFDLYQKIQEETGKVLQEMNDKRGAAGLEPINKIESYFPAGWNGDYRVFAFDSMGNKKAAFGFQTEFGAKAAVKQLQKDFPDLTIEHGEVKLGRSDIRDLQSFEEAIRIMGQKDPLTQALSSAYQKMLQTRGFGRRGLHRKGIEGFEGSRNIRDVETALNQYFNQAYRYIGNLEKQRILGELEGIPKEIREQVPETMEFLESYIHKARGAKLGESFVDDLLSGVSRAIGMGERGPQKVVQEVSALASLMWLTTPRFILSQTLQSMNAIPRLVKEFGVMDGPKMFFDGWLNTVSPDAIAKEAADWAGKKGYLDATIRNLVGKSMSEIPISKWEGIKEIASLPAARVEHSLVRLPVFMMFEKALREAIPDKLNRFERAAEKMDYYMVNYGRTTSPMVYDKGGVIGEMARPLKQYAHNSFGQFLEYAQHAKNVGDVAPLATFFGTQALQGGLKGVMLVAEATAIITAINALFDTEIPTPEKMLLKSNVPDLLIYGGMSTALGYDMSSSVSAPSLPNMFSFPAFEFSKKALVDVSAYMVAKAKGEETDQLALKAAMAVTPNAMHEWLKNAYTPEGMPTANPNNRNLEGSYIRNDTERFVASMIGLKSISEAKADTIAREVKKEIAKDLEKKLGALDAIADRIMNKQEIPQELLEKYVREGGDPSRLADSIKRRIIERQMTFEDRTQSKPISPSQANKLEIMKQYLDKQTPSRDKAPEDRGELDKDGFQKIGFSMENIPKNARRLLNPRAKDEDYESQATSNRKEMEGIAHVYKSNSAITGSRVVNPEAFETGSEFQEKYPTSKTWEDRTPRVPSNFRERAKYKRIRM